MPFIMKRIKKKKEKKVYYSPHTPPKKLQLQLRRHEWQGTKAFSEAFIRFLEARFFNSQHKNKHSGELASDFNIFTY